MPKGGKVQRQKVQAKDPDVTGNLSNASSPIGFEAHRPLRPVDLARIGGVSPQTVRRYEEWGVLPVATRTAKGYRRYSRAHQMAMYAARAVIAGYGRSTGVRVMQLVHAGRFTEAFRIADERHADLHARRLEATATLAARQGLTGSQPVAGWDQPIQIGNVGDGFDSGTPIWDQAGGASLGASFGASIGPGISDGFGDGFTMFDGEHLRRAQALAVLQSSPAFEAPDFGDDPPEQRIGPPDDASTAVAARLAAIDAATRRCGAATAVLWRYTRALERAAAAKSRRVQANAEATVAEPAEPV